MREILFRGKSDLLGWIEGWYCPEVNWGGHHFPVGITRKTKDGWLDDVAVIPETIGQFTGLTDKNGKKIFEGDVVRVCLDPEICVGDVIWDSEIASYNIPFNNGKCVLPLDILIAKNKVGDKVWIEVIGNIHDNPELLGGDWE